MGIVSQVMSGGYYAIYREDGGRIIGPSRLGAGVERDDIF